MPTQATGMYRPADDLDAEPESDIDVELDGPAGESPPAAPAAHTTLTPDPAGAPITGPGTARVPGQRRHAALRLPGAGDPAPHSHRLLGMCAWSTTLGLVGLAVAARAMVIIIAGAPAWWFEPAVVFAGLVGIGLAASAFMAVHRRRLPWLLLSGATAMLPLTMALVTT